MTDIIDGVVVEAPAEEAQVEPAFDWLAAGAPSPTGMVAIPFTVITPMPLHWLWRGWIPRRHVVLVVAPGGTGKGLWAAEIAARTSTGRPFPGETEQREPEAVVIVAPEDDPNETVAWRLMAAGADMSLVFNLTVMPDGSPFVLPDSVPELRAAIEEIEQVTGRHVGLVIIDPLMATVEKSIQSNIAARRAIGPLEKLAAEKNFACPVTHHTVKSGATAGSKGLTDACRLVLRIERPDKASTLRLVSVEKGNIGSDGIQLRYALAGKDNDSRVVYPLESATPAVSRGYAIALPSAEPEQEPDPETEAKVQQALAKAAGCKHASSKFGTPAQCGDCPAKKAMAAPVVAEPTKIPDGTPCLVYYCEQGQKAVKVGEYHSPGAARSAAEDAAHAHLPWKTDGTEGTEYGVIVKDGKKAAYTVFPRK